MTKVAKEIPDTQDKPESPPQGESGMTPPKPGDGGLADHPESPEESGWKPGKHILYAMFMLMRDVTDIPKTGQAPAKVGGYKFRGIEATIEKIGDAARTHGIMLGSEILREQYEYTVRGDKMWTSCALVIRYRFISLEDGSEITFESAGEGRDTSDKSTSKAMSMALKYALGQALLIGTGDDDPDSEKPEIPAGAPPAEPEEEVSPMVMAGRAVTAAQSANTRSEINRIRAHAESKNILSVQLGDHTLEARLKAIYATLPEGS